MKTLREKMRSRKGFTLIEMLIVVAIIAILVAISIPLVNSSLNKARIATDQANERAARAAAVIYYLTDENYEGGDVTLYYDAEDGILEPEANFGSITKYGQCTNHDNCVLKVTIDGDNGTVDLAWVKTANGEEHGDLHGIAGGSGAATGVGG